MPSRLEKSVRLNGTECLVAFPTQARKRRGAQEPSPSSSSTSLSYSRLAVIVTHPWNILGGNLHNNVVTATCLYFQRLGITTLRFNFKGTGLGRGGTQVEQLKAVAQGLLEYNQNYKEATEQAPTHLLLVGYSYGSLIASSASADIPQCIGVIAIAPPFAVQHWLLLFNTQYHLDRATLREALPRLFVIGTNDNFTSETIFTDYIEQNFPPEATTTAIIKDADHFFAKCESDVMHVIGEWILYTFRQCQDDLFQLRNLTFGITVPVRHVSSATTAAATPKSSGNVAKTRSNAAPATAAKETMNANGKPAGRINPTTIASCASSCFAPK